MKFAHAMLAFVAAAGVAAAQQPSVTVMVSSLGCSTTLGSDTFPISNWAFGVTAPTTGGSTAGGGGVPRPSFTLFSIGMSDNACGAPLETLLLNKKTIDTLTMTQFDPSTGKEVMTIQLRNVKVTQSYSNGVNQAVNFSYSRIVMTTYYPNKKQFQYIF